MTNSEIAAAFEELAVLYELDGTDRYRVLAYSNAARSIRDYGGSVADLAASGKVTEIPGIGKTLAEKIDALLAEGEIPAAVKLKRRIPEGLIEMNRIPGLGPKTVRRLHEELRIDSLEGLREAAETERIRELKGLGPKAEQNILEGVIRLEAAGDEPDRILLSEALPIARRLCEALLDHPACEAASTAGSSRRMKDTCGDLDLVASATDRQALAEHIAAHELIRSAGNASEDGVKLVTHSGLGVDVRIESPDAFGNLLQHFTGSAAHNAELRERAVAEGLSVSEHGITDRESGEVDRYETEEEVYDRIGYPYIPPELREDRGELDAARAGGLPELVEIDSIRGDLHSHTTLSDGVATLEEMAAAARERGYEYLAITDHSASHGFGNHVTAERLRERIEEIDAFNQGSDGFRLLSGSEVNIGTDGGLDYPDDLLDELDWVIASIHTSFSNDEAKMTGRLLAAIENPLVDCIGHPSGRLLLERQPYPFDVEAVAEAAAATGTMIEINGNPKRRDLSDIHARLAAEAGVTIVLTTDAHRPDSLDFMPYAVATARRAWLTANEVGNTRGWKELERLTGSAAKG